MRPFPILALAIALLVSGLSLPGRSQGTSPAPPQPAPPAPPPQARKDAFPAFGDQNRDGVFDTVTLPDQPELVADIDPVAATGVTYTSTGGALRRVIYYPARTGQLPQDGEYRCLGFVHYFDEEQLSEWFACVVYRLPGMAASTYKAEFVDQSGHAVGTPEPVLLNASVLATNPDFQRWQHSTSLSLLGVNPVAETRELFIFRRLPDPSDKVLLIFSRWF